jgi:glycerol-3-phosphate O-acyltransferase
VLRVLWQKLTGRFVRFGHAAVCYGAPLSLHDLRAQHPDLSADMLSAMLMTRIQAAIPVLPVPLVAAAIVRAGGKMPRDGLVPAIEALVASLQAQSAWLHLPEGTSAKAASEGLSALLLRGLVESRNDMLLIAPKEEQAVQFYASSILQRLSAPPGLAPQGTLELKPPSAGT